MTRVSDFDAVATPATKALDLELPLTYRHRLASLSD